MAKIISMAISVAVVLGLLHLRHLPANLSFVTPSISSRLTDPSHSFVKSDSKVSLSPPERSSGHGSRKSTAVPMKAGFMTKAAGAVGIAVVATFVASHDIPGVSNNIGLRRFLHLPIKVLTRWNEKWIGPVNFDRANLRITAMDTYAVCAGVLLQTIMCLFTSIQGNKPGPDDPRLDHLMYDFQIFFTSVAALCSSWTMVIFLFNKIYAVKAIAVYYDVNYAVFLSATRKYRIRAFQSLVISLISYVIAYGSTVFTTLSGRKGIYATLLICLFGTVMCQEGAGLIRDSQRLSGVDFNLGGAISVAEP